MKKIFIFAAAAAMLAACSTDKLEDMGTAQQKVDQAPLNFSVYTPRAVTRAGAAGDNNVDSIAKHGFGILAYYTDDDKYNSEISIPNYMYNTKVTRPGTTWSYNPVMYWPNEFGNSAVSDNVDFVSFFAYAPYIDVVNETGVPIVPAIDDYDVFVDSLKITYVKTDSVVIDSRALFEEAYNGGTAYTSDDLYIVAVQAKIPGTYSTADEATSALAAANPKLKFAKAVKHEVKTVADYRAYLDFTKGLADGTTTAAAATAELDNINKEQIQEKNITSISRNTAEGDPIVKYVVDLDPKTSVDLLWGVAADTTGTGSGDNKYYHPIAGNDPVVPGKPFIDLVKPNKPAEDKLKFNLRHALAKLNVDIRYIADATTPDGTSKTIDSTETRIYVRWIKIGGFVLKGALNLNNIKPNKANWKGYDGKTALTSQTVTFYDGRKDGKEGTENGTDVNELPVGLNPVIVENYSPDPAFKSLGVYKDSVNLFGVGAAPNKPIFVIPTGEEIDIEICYDVETRDDNLSTFLSDGVTHGSSIENKIRKTSKDIFGNVTAMEDNRFYTIHIILGMTSVKFDASVTEWYPSEGNVNLPDNTNGN